MANHLFAGSKLNGLIAEIMVHNKQQIRDEQSIQNHWSNLSYRKKVHKKCNFDKEESLLCKLVSNCLSSDQLRQQPYLLHNTLSCLDSVNFEV
jgi:hypothetical protein